MENAKLATRQMIKFAIFIFILTICIHTAQGQNLASQSISTLSHLGQLGRCRRTIGISRTSQKHGIEEGDRRYLLTQRRVNKWRFDSKFGSDPRQKCWSKCYFCEQLEVINIVERRRIDNKLWLFWSAVYLPPHSSVMWHNDSLSYGRIKDKKLPSPHD